MCIVEISLYIMKGIKKMIKKVERFQERKDNGKEFVIKYSDNHSFEHRQQEAWIDDEMYECDFSVYDLCECPEDAIIGRDLFDIKKYAEAITLGFQIACDGYTRLIFKEVPWEDE